MTRNDCQVKDASPVLADPYKAFHIINSATFLAPPFFIIHIPISLHHYTSESTSSYDEVDLLASTPLVSLHMLAHTASRHVLFRLRNPDRLDYGPKLSLQC